MKKRFVLALGVLALSATAFASKPVKTTLDGCFVEGFYFSKDGYQIHLQQRPEHPIDARALEGKQVRIAGLLYPGDSFRPSAAADVIGECPREMREKIATKLPWAYRGEARRLLAGGQALEALAEIEKAIRLDSDTCAHRMTRAAALEKLGRLEQALEDAKLGVAKGCDTAPSRALLRALEEKAPRKTAP